MPRQAIPRGQVAYEPNSLGGGCPSQAGAAQGFTSVAARLKGREDQAKVRAKPEKFADHYTQARLFWLSMTAPEQTHIVGAFAFELGKVETLAIRKRMLGRLDLVHKGLGRAVAEALGMAGEAETLQPAVEPGTMEPSPALSLIAKVPETLKGAKLGMLVPSSPCSITW